MTREHFKDDLEPSYQLVVCEWRTCRRLTAAHVEGAARRIVAAQTLDATAFLAGRVRHPGEAAVEVVSDWWDWAMEQDGGFDSYNPLCPFVPWAMSVLWFKSLAYRIRRFGGRRRMRILDEDVAASAHEPGESVEREEAFAVAREEVDRLPEKIKQAITARYWGGESSKASAEKSGGKPADYDRWRFRGKAILHKRLSRYMRSERLGNAGQRGVPAAKSSRRRRP